jgi:hypothetical protein
MIKIPKAFEVKVSKALSIFIVLTHIVYFVIIKSNKQKFEVKKMINIRQARQDDISRLAEIEIFNYRLNFNYSF